MTDIRERVELEVDKLDERFLNFAEGVGRIALKPVARAVSMVESSVTVADAVTKPLRNIAGSYIADARRLF